MYSIPCTTSDRRNTWMIRTLRLEAAWERPLRKGWSSCRIPCTVFDVSSRKTAANRIGRGLDKERLSHGDHRTSWGTLGIIKHHEVQWKSPNILALLYGAHWNRQVSWRRFMGLVGNHQTS